ncbi:hypothetical protein M5K25_000188 [Dendrobium thyrsiflorum]|uniref:NB-ARC domain-containing protein n=1 Tax=Dendrobium thyrsiflorum TaxID=117978 RepID=A0ABD0VSY3_DENTH
MAEAGEHSVVIPQVKEEPSTAVEQEANVVDPAIPAANMVEHKVTKEDDQPEAERKKLEKTVKEKWGTVFLALNVAIIAAAIANKNRPGSRSRGELIFLGISVGFAMLSFLVWAFLLIFIQLTKIENNILSGSFVIGILSMATSVVFLSLSVWVQRQLLSPSPTTAGTRCGPASSPAPLSTTGFVLNSGQSRSVDIPSSWSGRLWGRTYRSTNQSTSTFSCVTGDCGSGKIDWSGSGATPPATLAEFTLNGSSGMDFFDVSLVDGYNLHMLISLAYGSFGSRILVTTRMDSIAMMIAKVIKKKTEIYRLEGLVEDQCLQLLNSHAFADVENPNDYKRLRSIAGEIVKKLLGSPLAAKVIGGILNDNLDERHWTKVLNSDFVSPKLGQNDIFLILRLSYMFLPKHLQNCFSFCSIFRQDYWFNKDDLVRMWIALGFIQQPHDQEWAMEDIGGIMKILLDDSTYKMHDLIHELAQSISMHECLRVEDDTKLPSIIPKTLRHLSVKTTNPDIMKMIGQFKYLHSLILFDSTFNPDIWNVLIEIFKAWRSLRLLYIHASTSKGLILEEIGNLIHLRYLKFSNCNLAMLPRSLSNLYHLQYIISYNQYLTRQNDDFLPSDINNLSNLCYMKLPENYISLICGIGKLKSLQELNMFDLRDESIALKMLRVPRRAYSAKLFTKRRLTDLTLCWSNTASRNIDLDENVLDNLQPPKQALDSQTGRKCRFWLLALDTSSQQLHKQEGSTGLREMRRRMKKNAGDVEGEGEAE